MRNVDGIYKVVRYVQRTLDKPEVKRGIKWTTGIGVGISLILGIVFSIFVQQVPQFKNVKLAFRSDEKPTFVIQLPKKKLSLAKKTHAEEQRNIETEKQKNDVILNDSEESQSESASSQQESAIESNKVEITDGTVAVNVKDNNGNEAGVESKVEQIADNKVQITLKEQQNNTIKPGKYTLQTIVEQNGETYNLTQDFTWGVLAINPDQSVYSPNQEAFLAMAVLDDRGNMVCDAKVELEITDPKGKKTILSTINKEIVIAPTCSVKDITEKPDYYGYYKTAGAGEYKMKLRAETQNGPREIEDRIYVEENPLFEIKREGPTRVYPPATYKMKITAKANLDFPGPVREFVPESFEIIEQEGLHIEVKEGLKILTWEKDFKDGETQTLEYEFRIPPISPQFYLLGPLEIGPTLDQNGQPTQSDHIFREKRQWQIAADADIAIVTTDATGALEQSHGMRSIVFTSASVGYFFYIAADDDFGVAKTTDGGQTWNILDADIDDDTTTTVYGFDVWYDQWTPGDSGTLIYIWWFEAGDDTVVFRTLNTSDDSWGTQYTVWDGASAALGRGTFVSGAKARGNNLLVAFDIDNGTEIGTYRSTDGGQTWGVRTNMVEAAAGDELMMFPGNETDNQDMWALYQDASADALTLKMHDDSANTNSESATIVSLIEQITDGQGQRGFSGTIRSSDGHLLAVTESQYDIGTADMQTWDINGTGSITQKGAISTDVDDQYYSSIYIDSSDTVRVAYIGKRDGLETLGTAAGVYYTTSTDGMTTWSVGDSAYSATISDWRQTWVPLSGPRFLVVWRDISDFRLLTNYDNSVIVTPQITVSGGCFTDAGEGTPCTDGGAGDMIKVAVNGTTDAGSDGTVDGAWSFTINQPNTDDILVFYRDGADPVTERATTVVKYDGDGGNVTEVKMYESMLVIGADSGSTNSDQTIINADLDTTGNGFEFSDDNDSIYGIDTGALTVDQGAVLTETLYIISGDIFQPDSGGGDTVNTHHLYFEGTFTTDNNTVNVAGDWTNAGTFTANTSTVDFNGSGTQLVNPGGTGAGKIFNNLTRSGSGTLRLVTNAIDIDGNFQLTGGIFDAQTNNLSQNFAGDFSLSAETTFSSGGTLTFDKAGTTVFTDSTAGIQNLGTVTIGPSTTTIVNALTTDMEVTNLTVGADDTLNITNMSLTISGTGTPFTITDGTGTFTSAGSTVIYTGTTTTTDIATTTYNNLTLTPSSATTYNLTNNLSNGNSLTGTLTVNANATLDTTGANYAITAPWINIASSGALTANGSTIALNGTSGTLFTKSGNFNADSSTVIMSSDASVILTSGTITFNHLQITPTITANQIYTFGPEAINLTGDLTIYPSAGSTKNLTINMGAAIIVSGATSINETSNVTVALDTVSGPSHAFTTASLTLSNNSTFTANDSIITLTGTGDPLVNNATLNINSSTFVFTGAGATSINALNYYNLEIKPSVNSATHTLSTGTFGIQNNFTLGNGTNTVTIDWTFNDPVINVGGNLIVDNNTSWTKSDNATLTFNGATTPVTWRDDNGTTQDMGNVTVDGTTKTVNTLTSIATTNLTIGADDILDISNDTLSISGDYSNSNTLTATSSTVDFTGSSTQTLNSGGIGAGKIFNNLTHSGAGTLQLITNPINIDGIFTNSNGTFDANDLDMNVADDFLISGGSFSADVSPGATTQTVIFDGTNEATVSGLNTFNNLTMNTTTDGAKTIKFPTGLGSKQTINGTWTLDGDVGKVLTLRSVSDTIAWEFVIPADINPSGDYIDVKDSQNNTNAYRITAGANYVDSGNNVPGWIFVTNQNPDDPDNLAQKKTDNTVISDGGWTNELSVKYTETVTDGDGDQVQLCVEKKVNGVGFDNAEDSCGTLVASGNEANVTIGGHITDTQYHWQARTKDEHGAYSSWVVYPAADPDYGIDTSAPTGGSVVDGTDASDDDYNDGSLSSLSAFWTGTEPTSTVSGLQKYQYAIGTTQGGTDIKAWTDNGTTTTVTSTGLTLQTSIKYYFSVRAVDNAGNTQDPPNYTNGQYVLPTLSFSISTNTITFANLNNINNYQDTENMTITTSTNGYNGYRVKAYKTQLLTSIPYPTKTIADFQGGTWATPGSWPAAQCTDGTDCGFGYTSGDDNVESSNRFQPSGGFGTKYCPFSSTPSGDTIADNIGPVSGTPITNEQFNITAGVAAPTIQAASQYRTYIIFIATANY